MKSAPNQRNPWLCSLRRPWACFYRRSPHMRADATLPRTKDPRRQRARTIMPRCRKSSRPCWSPQPSARPRFRALRSASQRSPAMRLLREVSRTFKPLPARCRVLPSGTRVPAKASSKCAACTARAATPPWWASILTRFRSRRPLFPTWARRSSILTSMTSSGSRCCADRKGRLYGSSSIGGTVRLIPSPPELNTYAASAEEAVSYTASGGNINNQTNVMMNFPLGGHRGSAHRRFIHRQ